VLDAPRGEREGPVVEVHAADAEGVVDALVGAGGVAVEGDGDLEAELGHRDSVGGSGARWNVGSRKAK
jgi:hypothetical protein